jgi:hypothetical protein
VPLIIGSIAGEHDASVAAGVATLIGVLLGVLAAAAAYDSARREKLGGKSTAWALGFAALFFASLGTAGGLWSLAGSTGLIFVITALVLTVIIASSIIWRKQLRRQVCKWRIWFLK